MDWSDFNIGIVVITPNGRAVVESVDKLNDRIHLTNLQTAKREFFKISELSIQPGQIKLSFCTQIGQFILLFQRLENRLKDFVNYTLSLNKNQRKELTSDFTAGRLKSKIDGLFKKYSTQENANKWKEIALRVDKLRDIRNTLIHGYLFHFNEKFELDTNSLYFENSNGKYEFLDDKKMNELIDECLVTYYSAHNLFIEMADLVKEEINKS